MPSAEGVTLLGEALGDSGSYSMMLAYPRYITQFKTMPTIQEQDEQDENKGNNIDKRRWQTKITPTSPNIQRNFQQNRQKYARQLQIN